MPNPPRSAETQRRSATAAGLLVAFIERLDLRIFQFAG
jgi:hypothetical protein